MKFYSIKPIRIRFVSGRIECANLEQLRSSFSPYHIIASYAQFNKWLDQIQENEVKKDFNQRLVDLKMEGKSLIVKSQEALYSLYKIFFNKDIQASDLVSLVLEWHNNLSCKSNYQFLFETISCQQWGESFLFEVAQKAITEKVDSFNTDELLYKEYTEFLSEAFKKNNIRCLSELFLYLAKSSCNKSHFEFLYTEIRKYDWSTSFFIRYLLPKLFEEDNDGISLVKLENVSFNLSDEENVFKLYNFFLERLFKEEAIKSLSDIFFLFLFDEQYKENFLILQKIISNSGWNLDFAYKVIPSLRREIHGKQKKDLNYSFSDESEENLLGLYRFFLIDFSRTKTISSLRELYLLWDRNDEYEKFFFQLHHDIIDSDWGKDFLNSIFDTIWSDWGKRTGLGLIKEEKNLIAFYSRYFSNEIGDLKNKKSSVLSKLYMKWAQAKDEKGKRWFQRLELAFETNLWGIRYMLDIYESDRLLYNINSQERWFTILRELSKCKSQDVVLHLFQIGKYLIEDFDNYKEGLELLDEAKRQGSPEARTYWNELQERERKVSEDFKNLYLESYKKAECKRPTAFKPNENLRASAKSLREKWVMKTLYIIYGIINENKKTNRFLTRMQSLAEDDSVWSYGLEDPILFFEIFRNYARGFFSPTVTEELELMKKVAEYSDHSFLELRFILALISTTDSKFSQEGWNIMNSIKALYIPAEYMLDQNKKDPILDKINFRELVYNDINEALREYCQVMVLFC